jgi:hypothetical protein
MSISIFLSTVSDEFRLYRDQLRGDLTRHDVEVKVQEDFKGLGADTLDKLDTYIAHCDAVVHLVGEMTGSAPSDAEVQALLRKHRNLPGMFPPLDAALRNGDPVSYTQWEAWLALYHGALLLTAKADPAAPRADAYAPTDASRAAQTAHLARLEVVKRYPDCTFSDVNELAARIAYTGVMDLLVKHRADKSPPGRQRLMRRGIAAALVAILAGIVWMIAEQRDSAQQQQQIVRDQQDIQAQIAQLTQQQGAARGLNQPTVAELTGALSKLQAQYDANIAQLGGFLSTVLGHDVPPEQYTATLLKVAADWKTAGDRIDALSADRIQTPRFAELKSRAKAAHDAGRLDDAQAALAEIGRLEADSLARMDAEQRDLATAITARRRGLADTRVASATTARARLDYREEAAQYAAAAEAIEPVDPHAAWAFWLQSASALYDRGREYGDNDAARAAIDRYETRVLPRAARPSNPLDWAMTQNNLGNALQRLGERESGTVRLEQAVTAYRAALEERTRDRVPLDWAATQNNLGRALLRLGERESGTARLEQAVAAYRAALEERTRDHVPLDWAFSRHNLANALALLAQRRHDRAQMVEAIAAMRDAAEVYREGNNSYALPIAERRIGEMEAELAVMP